MRTIKFRAQNIASNKWLYGDIRYHTNDVYIFEQGGIIGEQVKPETVGQFTGKTDKNGTDVYEGDIVRYRPNNKVYQVVFKDGIFWGEGNNGHGCAAHFFPTCEIIGNVFDNSELIEKGGEHE